MRVSFSADLREYELLEKLLQKAPVTYRLAVLRIVNDLAFKVKMGAPSELAKNLIIRNPRFVSTSFRVQKASLKNPVAVAGSIYRPRFTGWIEQEGLGEPRHKAARRAARPGGNAQQIPAKFRAKPGRDFLTPARLGFVASPKSIPGMVAKVARMAKSRRKPIMFQAKKGRIIPQAIYRMTDENAVKMIWRIRQTKIKRRPWMVATIKRAINPTEIRQNFAQALVKAFAPLRK